MEIVIREERQRQHVIDLISKLASDKIWCVEIKKYVKSRTLNANNLYWKWLGIIGDETGNDGETIHEFCKRKFLRPTLVDVGGEKVALRLSTTKLSTIDFGEYMTKVEAWAATDLGISLPHPEDQHQAPPRKRTRGGVSDLAHDLDTQDTYEARRGQ